MQKAVKQPFSNLPHVWLSQELIDMAFSRASKVSVAREAKLPKEAKARIKEAARIQSVGDAIANRLEQVVKGTPRVEAVHPFYAELADLLVDVGKLKKSLAAANWAAQMVRRLHREYLQRVRRAKSVTEARDVRRAFYGRVASVLEQVSADLEFLKRAFDALKKLPSIDPDTPTVIVAGYANVGKSCFVRSVSSAKPEVATYPFTTKQVTVGHRKTSFGVCQVVDTPGLLDRPLHKRNKVELQAIAALRHISHSIIFLFDPTETCGYPLKSQVRLYREIREMFPKPPMLLAANKIDIATGGQLALLRQQLGDVKLWEVSALKGVGVEELIEEAAEAAASFLRKGGEVVRGDRGSGRYA